MSRGLKWFIAITASLFTVIVLVLVLARYHDGPVGIISGGPFDTGEPVTGITDWQFLDDEFQTVELQTMEPPRSRTMWLVAHNGRPYVVSSYMKTAVGKVWKKWPRQLEKDNRAIVRADNRLYTFRLIRIPSDDAVVKPVVERLAEKYRVPLTVEDVETENTWLYELRPY